MKPGRVPTDRSEWGKTTPISLRQQAPGGQVNGGNSFVTGGEYDVSVGGSRKRKRKTYKRGKMKHRFIKRSFRKA